MNLSPAQTIINPESIKAPMHVGAWIFLTGIQQPLQHKSPAIRTRPTYTHIGEPDVQTREEQGSKFAE